MSDMKKTRPKSEKEMTTYKMSDFKQPAKADDNPRPQPTYIQSTLCKMDNKLFSPLVIKEEAHVTTNSFVTDTEEDEDEEVKVSDDSVSTVSSKLTDEESAV